MILGNRTSPCLRRFVERLEKQEGLSGLSRRKPQKKRRRLGADEDYLPCDSCAGEGTAHRASDELRVILDAGCCDSTTSPRACKDAVKAAIREVEALGDKFRPGCSRPARKRRDLPPGR